MTPPPCPHCHEALRAIRSDTRGVVWCYCPDCRVTVLVDADGHILHVSAKP